LNEDIAPADCIFCQIVAGAAPAHRVYEDEQTLVFMDIFPVSDGHTLVIPKAHCSNLLDAGDEDLRRVIAHSRRVAHAIRYVLQPDGIGVFQLNGAAAGQTVFHYHMHLIPRHAGDPLVVHTRTPGRPERLAEVARDLAAALESAN
jgi:histidine triad (HIT) family protein